MGVLLMYLIGNTPPITSIPLSVPIENVVSLFPQQERQLIGQMEEVLRHERVKMQALLVEERASSARRIGALQKELDAARRQLELERNRATKVRAHR